MKKILLFILTIVLLLCASVTNYAHIHDDYCGYDETTQTGCIYEQDDDGIEEDIIKPRLCVGPDCPIE